MGNKAKSRLNVIEDTYQVFYFSLISAGLMHLAFLFFFFWLDIQPLVAFNIFSCLTYYVCSRLFIQSTQSEDYRLIAAIASVEVVAHAYLVSYYIGLDSGFHYYILVLSIIPMINAGVAMLENIIKLAMLFISYIALLIWLHDVTPIVVLDDTLILLLQCVNAVVVIISLGLVSMKMIYIVALEKAALSHLATTDKLTGLYNRRGFMALIEKEVNSELQQDDALSILVLDVDLFKEVNDQYGHQCGDYVLTQLAQVMRTTLRKHEMIARWGGDEFIVLLPDTDKSELAILAERLRASVEETKFNFQNQEIMISVSVGGTTYQVGDSFETLASRADKALYKVKGNGGNSFYTVHA